MMDTLLRKYLDGELSEDEALEFLEAIADDPELNRQVAALEEVVALGTERPDVAVSPQFTERVMASIDSRSLVPAPKKMGVWQRRLPLAASWVLAVGLGYFLAAGGPGQETAVITASGGEVQAMRTATDSPQVVRLVYATSGRDVAQVGVAGSFNNWDPASTPMRRENGVWVAMLMLPPDSYEYMFVEDNVTWVTDPLAQTTRDDGFGSRNAILDIGI